MITMEHFLYCRKYTEILFDMIKSKLPTNTLHLFEEDIDADEWGLVLEGILQVSVDHNIPFTPAALEIAENLAKVMKMDGVDAPAKRLLNIIHQRDASII